MVTMGIVAMLSQTHGEYWLAGAVSATFALANAFISPQVSRFVDRYGQARVLIPVTTVSVVAFAGLLLATRAGWADWTLFAFAVLAGTMPSMPAMVRARWTSFTATHPSCARAFSFESVADEVIYMIGSVASVGLSVASFPKRPPCSTLLLLAGTALFVVQKSTEPSIQAAEATNGPPPSVSAPCRS